MKEIVVAKYKEDVSWLLQLRGFACTILDKSRDVHDPDNWNLRNVGRESHSYLHWIVNSIRGNTPLPDEVILAQGNPFPHDPDFINNLHRDSVRWYGTVYNSSVEDDPHMPDANLDSYCRVLGLPVRSDYKFVAGAQYRLTREQILSRPLAFYECLLALTQVQIRSPWSLERLWPEIWGIELPDQA